MTRSDHPAAPGPKGRTDSTRPPRTTRGADHKPHPSAPVRTASTTPTPATVWACGPTPLDPDTTWPTPILTKIVTSFSEPGDRVVVLPWPAPAPRPPRSPVRAGGPIDRAPATEPDEELSTALAAIADLGRAARVVRVEPDLSASGRASRPFWADLIDVPDPTRAPEPDSPPDDAPDAGANRLDVTAADTDLIITSLRPEHNTDRASDHVALLAARLLRLGGILVVLTHSDWSQGELLDPTGLVVACAQNADLLYLQHIVALHAPVRGGELVCRLHGAAASAQTRTRHRAHVRGLPAPHHRISSDVLVFAQPHDHEPPPLAPAGFETGVIR